MENPKKARYFINQQLFDVPPYYDWFSGQLQSPYVNLLEHDAYVDTSFDGKRKMEGEFIPLAESGIKRKRGNLAKKTPFMYFCEVFPTSAKQLTIQPICDEGNITYVSSVMVMGEMFHGKGRSKQTSKHSMAESVLARFLPDDFKFLNRVSDEATAASNVTTSANEFSSQQTLLEVEQSGNEQETLTSKDKKCLLPTSGLGNKPPCQLLVELCQRNGNGNLPVFELTKLDDGKVSCKLTIGENSVEAISDGRKRAKNLAAEKALLELLKVEPVWLEKCESERNRAAVLGLTAPNALMKLCGQKRIPVKFSLEKSSDHPGQMKVICQVGDESFEAVGTKRKVRTLASMKALKEIFHVDYEDSEYSSPLVMPKDLQTKTPCQLLNEVLVSQGQTPVEYTGFDVDPSGQGFRAFAKFDDEEYIGCGLSKKKAKQESASSDLIRLGALLAFGSVLLAYIVCRQKKKTKDENIDRKAKEKDWSAGEEFEKDVPPISKGMRKDGASSGAFQSTSPNAAKGERNSSPLFASSLKTAREEDLTGAAKLASYDADTRKRMINLLDSLCEKVNKNADDQPFSISLEQGIAMVELLKDDDKNVAIKSLVVIQAAACTEENRVTTSSDITILCNCGILDQLTLMLNQLPCPGPIGPTLLYCIGNLAANNDLHSKLVVHLRKLISLLKLKKETQLKLATLAALVNFTRIINNSEIGVYKELIPELLKCANCEDDLGQQSYAFAIMHNLSKVPKLASALAKSETEKERSVEHACVKNGMPVFGKVTNDAAPTGAIQSASVNRAETNVPQGTTAILGSLSLTTADDEELATLDQLVGNSADSKKAELDVLNSLCNMVKRNADGHPFDITMDQGRMLAEFLKDADSNLVIRSLIIIQAAACTEKNRTVLSNCGVFDELAVMIDHLPSSGPVAYALLHCIGDMAANNDLHVRMVAYLPKLISLMKLQEKEAQLTLATLAALVNFTRIINDSEIKMYKELIPELLKCANSAEDFGQQSYAFAIIHNLSRVPELASALSENS
ncbi:dsrm domain containing protein [Trichuris trichiura]|uniref:Dsrm domain containing protein n=1 Tax=Trichuris trichiura TaxID=36087 RepID=A0A077YY80_TRITR|nr:dsrm domain containing protein [Trichuris trichiura]